MPLRLTAAAVSLCCLLAAAAPASAHHVASATASLAMDPASPSCKLVEKSYKSKCRGSRMVRVTWSVSCGYPDPIVNVRFWNPRPGKSPVEMVTEEYSGELSGVTVKRIGAGTRVFATVKVFCDDPGDGDTVEAHRAEAESVPTGTAVIPPRLVRVTSVKNSFCGFVPSLTQQRYGLQARQTSGWDFTLLFDDDSLLGGNRHTHAGRVKTRLRSKGAGINYNDIAAPWVPGVTGRIPTAAGTTLVPRRAGPLKVWAVIGGAKTNVLTLRVLPRKGC
jgi:hypothetical protein